MKKIVKIIMSMFAVIVIMGIIGYCIVANSQVTEITNGVLEEKIYTNPKYQSYVNENDIVREKKGLGGLYKIFYDKHIAYKAPNGKKIYIVANKEVKDEQLLKAYNVLSMYLETDNGYDMTSVINKVADSGAKIVMPDGADGNSKTPFFALLGQPLYYGEVPTEGDEWYTTNDYSHRDATYEEILHFVHDNGIGTLNNSGVLPELQKKIYGAMINSLPKDKSKWSSEGVWGLSKDKEDLNTKQWLLELEKEGSLEQEYFAAVTDSYYGLWAPYKDSVGGMWGIYIAKDREEIKEKDQKGYELAKDFLPENLTYMANISSEFMGSFKMYYDDKEPYTHKSKYLTNARLLGEKNSSLLGNNKDNVLIGNKGNNTIDGKYGIDVVQFIGASNEYYISQSDHKIMVKDKENRDGTDILINIEILRFTDKDISY